MEAYQAGQGAALVMAGMLLQALVGWDGKSWEWMTVKVEVLVLAGQVDQEASLGVLVEVVQEDQMVGHSEGRCKGTHWQLDLEMVSSVNNSESLHHQWPKMTSST